MKIGLNATCLNDRPSGARQRFTGIYGALVRRMPEAEFVVYEPADCRVGAWFAGAPNVSARRTPLPSEGRARKLINGLRYWREALPRERFDIFERFNLPIVKAPTGRTLLTIHDIRSMRPRRNGLQRTAAGMFLGKSLRAADHVITVSEAMKQEILGFYPDVPISVVYNGLDRAAMDQVSESDMQAVRRKYAFPETFVLAVGHFEERKNYLRLVDAMAWLRDRGRGCALRIIGNDSGEGRAIQKRIASANLSDSVKLLSGLSDLEVRCAYRLCKMFVFPSSYEGFGIPVLEAMAAGRPMALSDIAVFREITEGRSVYFRHDAVESMAMAIDNVLSSGSERKRLVAYGNERVRDFGFDGLAAQVERLYRSLHAGTGG